MDLAGTFGTDLAVGAQPAAGAVAGAIIGSFIATLVLRWPAGRSVVSGRSACDGCGRSLSARDLVPLMSYVLARGKCRSCGARIDALHPLAEMSAAVIGGLALWMHPGIHGLAGAVFGWTLLALALLDARFFWLPDRLTLPLAAAGLFAGFAGVLPSPGDRLTGLAAGWLTLAAIAWGYRRWRGRQGMGGGDPKLAGAIGAWLGWVALPLVLSLAAGLGLAFVAIRLLAGGKVSGDTQLPFGTFLGISAWLIWLTWPLPLSSF